MRSRAQAAGLAEPAPASRPAAQRVTVPTLGAAQITDYTMTSLVNAGDGGKQRELSFLTGLPLWCDGRNAGWANQRGFTPPSNALTRFALKIDPDNTKADAIHMARFYLAGGL